MYLQDNFTFAIPKKRERKRDEAPHTGRSQLCESEPAKNRWALGFVKWYSLPLYVLLQQEWCGNRSNQYRK